MASHTIGISRRRSKMRLSFPDVLFLGGDKLGHILLVPSTEDRET